jgi:MFS family permease
MQPPARKRVNLMIASTMGTILEFYDFFAFAACAVLVFDKQFFAANDPFVATLLALGTFTVGFIARPVGGILFGIAGDRVGRKRMLVISLLMMGIGTFAIGLLPTYSTIGIAAPLLLVLLRIVQGLAAGGEATGAILMIAESMPAENRGFWTSFTMWAGPAANVLAASVIAIAQGIWGDQAFVEWAWRIPFFISLLLVFLGFWTRRRIEESPAFLELAARQHKVAPAPLREAFIYNKQEMGLTFFVKAAENTFLYLFSTFLLLMATKYLGFSRNQAINALLWGSALEIFVILAAAQLSDKLGRRPVILVGLLCSMAAGFGLFTLAPGASFGRLQFAVALCLASHGVILGAMAAYLAELFPTWVRYTGLSTSYQLASVLGGSIAPIVGTVLLEKTGTNLSVAIYAAAMAIPALVWVYLSRETRGRDFFEDKGGPHQGQSQRPAMAG